MPRLVFHAACCPKVDTLPSLLLLRLFPSTQPLTQPTLLFTHPHNGVDTVS